MSRIPPPPRFTPFCRLAMLLAVVVSLVAGQVVAQDVFFTQSGGRGLQNAKMSARVSKAENDIGDVQAELAKVQPFAKTPIPSCADPGSKLRWSNDDWLCDSENDPTVQPFAKKSLPSCGAGQLLTASGSDFTCTSSGFLAAEADPTVQNFAKSALPSCGGGQVLTVSGGTFNCSTDERGLTVETDPLVHGFAKTGSAAPNCPSGQVLTMQSGQLACVFDTVGLTIETDPKVQDFARNDVAGYSLTACATGEVLTAATVSGKVLLQCASGSAALGEVIGLDDLSDVDTTGQVSGSIIRYDGTGWVVGNEADTNTQAWARSTYTLSTCTSGQVLTYNGTQLACISSTAAIGTLNLSDLSDTDVAGVTGGQFLQYVSSTSKWEPADVQHFAQVAVGACPAGQFVRTYTNSGQVELQCASVASALSDSLFLNELADVTITTPNVGQPLRYDGNGWSNGAIPSIGAGNSVVQVFDTGTGLIQLAPDGASVLAVNGTRVGILTNSPSTELEVMGTISATNLRLSGNLYVSGSQSFDGVTFANGGVSATGVVTATSFYGDGSNLTGVTASNVSWTNVLGKPASVVSLSTLTASLNDLIYFNGTTYAGTSGTTLLGLGSMAYQNASNVSITGGNATGLGTVSGTYGYFTYISGTNIYGTFSGDGSGLTGVVASTGDRIVSGTTSMLAVSTTGYISVTQGGANTAWFDPTRGLVALGVSTTGAISATSGYFGGLLRVAGGDIRMDSNADIGYNAGLASYSGMRSGSGSVQFFTQNIARVAINSVGRVAIGNTSPSQTLHVSGTLLTTSWTGINFDSTNVTPTAPLEVSGTVSATRFVGDGSQLTGVTADATDKIVSGTTQMVVVSSTGFVSLTQAGANTGWFDPTRGLVTLGVSSTGPISGTRGYFSGLVQAMNSVRVTGNISATDAIQVGGSSLTCDAGIPGAIRYSSTSATIQVCDGIGWVNLVSGTAGSSNVAGIDDLNDAATSSTTGNLFLTHEGGSAGATDQQNVGIGYTALDSLNDEDADDNIAIGRNALTSMVSGTGNVAIGGFAMDQATRGESVAIGYRAGYGAVGDGSDRITVIGANAGWGNTAGGLSAFGFNAGHDNTGNGVALFGTESGLNNNGNNVLAFGNYSAWNNDGSDVVGIGPNAARENAGNSVVGIGASAAYQNTGNNGLFIGNNAGRENTSYNVTTIGHDALRYRDASDTVAIGVEAGYGADATRRNIGYSAFMGYRSGYNITTGEYNTLLGYQSGYNLSSGSGNLAIGASADLPAPTGDNQLNIGNTIYGNLGTKRIAIGASTTTPGAQLVVSGTISATDAIQVGQSSLTCASGIAGSLRYSSISNTMQLCDGTSWVGLTSGTTSDALGDRIVSNSVSVIAHGPEDSISLSTGNVTRMSIASNGRVGIGVDNPREALEVVGNLEIGAAASGQKSYRMRTSGGELDFEASGARLYISTWQNADYSGTQYNYLQFNNTGHGASAFGEWNFFNDSAQSYFTLFNGGAVGLMFNRDRNNIDFNFRGDNDENLIYGDAATDRIGIGTNDPRAKLDVSGTISATDAIQVGSSSLTCVSGISGSIRYNTSSNTIQVCDGTSWVSLVSGTAGASVAGSSNQVQYNNGGVLAADGNFVYISGTGTVSVTRVSATNVSATSGAFYGLAAGSFNATHASTTLIQIGNGGGVACGSSVSGSIRYSAVSNTLQLCDGTSWVGVTSGTAAGVANLDDLGDVSASLTRGAMIMGSSAGLSASAVNSVTVIGFRAGSAMVSGAESLAIGSNAMEFDMSPKNSTFVGAYAGRWVSSTVGHNTALGTNAMRGGSTTPSNNSATYNVAVGSEAMRAAQSSSNSVALGFQAMDAMSAGAYNIAIGSQAMSFGSSAWTDNIAIGYQAMRGSGVNARNVVIGNSSNGAGGDDNVIIGHSARSGGGTAKISNSVYIGAYAGLGQATASNNNTAVGAYAMYDAPGGSGVGVPLYNSSLGAYSLYSVGPGTHNVAMGYRAQYSNVSGSANVVVGSEAGYNGGSTGSVTGTVAIGYRSGYSMNGGGSNTFVGYQSGYGVTSGGNNILIGANTSTSAPTTSDQLNIGNVIYGDLANSKVSIGISTTTIGASGVQVSGTISATDAIQVGQSSLTCASGISGSIRYNTTSATIQVCDGTGWVSLASGTTGGGGGVTDRITSGTSLVTVNSNTSTISFTTAGVVTGYVDSTGRLIVPGISVTTNQLSATTGYFSGKIGVGTTAPYYQVDVYTSDTTVGMRAYNSDNGASSQAQIEVGNGLGVLSRITAYGNSAYYGTYSQHPLNITTSNTTRLFISDTGQVGINTMTPAATLDVVGSISGSTISATLAEFRGAAIGVLNATYVSGSLIQVGTGASATCASGISGSIRYNTTSATIQVCDGTGWVSLASGTTGGGGGGATDNITSGTTNVTVNSNTSTISLTTAGVITGYVDSTGRLIVPGISVTTNQLSGTTGYFSRRVGVGVTPHGTTNIPLFMAGNNSNFAIDMTNFAVTILSASATSGNPELRLMAGAGGVTVSNTGSAGFTLIKPSNNLATGITVQRYDSDRDDRYAFRIQREGGVIPFGVTGNGNLGIGGVTPTLPLEVSGTVSATRVLVYGTISATNAIQVGQSSLTCASGISGSIRYNTTSDTIQLCNGTGWVSLASGTTSGGGTPGGATTEVQYNNNGSFGADANFTYVSGTQTISVTRVSATTVRLASDTALVCSASTYGTMRFDNGRVSLCRP